MKMTMTMAAKQKQQFLPKGDLLAILDMAVSVLRKLDEDKDIKADNCREKK